MLDGFFLFSLTLKLGVTTNNPYRAPHNLTPNPCSNNCFCWSFFSFPPFVLSFSSHKGTLPSFARDISNSHAKVLECENTSIFWSSLVLLSIINYLFVFDVLFLLPRSWIIIIIDLILFIFHHQDKGNCTWGGKEVGFLRWRNFSFLILKKNRFE